MRALRINRKHLLWIVLALGLANVAFLYFATRPKLPEVVLEGSQGSLILDGAGEIGIFVYLDEKRQWRTPDGKLADLAFLVELTIPNIDGPDYSISVEQPKRWTFGDALAAIRSAARDGVCNIIIIDREMISTRLSDSNRVEVPLLEIAEFSQSTNGPLKPCLTDPIIKRRLANASQGYLKAHQDDGN
jgi:hypothetical protein